MENKSKRLLANTLIFTIGNLGSKFIQFLLVPLYTYTLTAEQYGITEIVLTAVNLLIPVFSISIADGLLRFGLDKNLNKGSVLKTSFVIVLFGSILSILAIPIFSLNSTLHEWLFYFILILNLRIYRDVFAIQLKVDEKNKLFAVDSILYTFVLSIASLIFLVPLSMGISGYFMAYVIANIFSIAFIILVGKGGEHFRQGKIEKKLLCSLLVYSVPMILNGIAWWLTNAADRFMLQWFMDDAAVGIYSVAAKIPSFITTFTGVFNQAWIISAVMEHEDENDKNFYNTTFRQYYVVLFMSAVVLITFIQPFMKIYVSSDYYEAWQYTPFLIMSAVASGIAAFTTGFYSALKKNINIMITTSIGAISNIGLNFVLIPNIGIMGAAIATYISWLIVALFRMIDISRFSHFVIPRKVLIYLGLLLIQTCLITFYTSLGIVFSIILLLILFIQEKNLLLTMFKKRKRL